VKKKIEYDDFNKQFPELTKMSGVGVGEGWYPLVWEMFERLTASRLARGLPISEEHPLHFSTIKEKYGTLRAYAMGALDEDWAIIQMYEDMSQFVCEQCGEPGRIRGRYWLYAACDAHTHPQDVRNELYVENFFDGEE
jgi:hypothetical protein